MSVSESKVGRNEPCACGSGKKYKHCCARKAERRARVQDSMFKGAFLLFGPLVVALGLAVAIASLRGNDVTDGGYERVWSSAHGHWHAVLPDGSEVEVQPGMVWVPEHGHFHRAQAPTDALRSHVTSQLDQHLDDVENDPQ